MALWDTNPPAGAGCPLLAGWRVVVDWCAPWQSRPRAYGDLTYGDLTYGAETAQPARWYDITEAVSITDIVRGCPSGENWRVPVDSATFTIVDETGTVVQIPDTDPTDVDRLAVGCRIRAGVVSPAGTYTPLFTGRVETLEDVHDEPPRTVTVEAFGHTMDLNYAVPAARAAETTRTRLTAILAANAYWDWAPFDYTAVTDDPALLAVAAANATVRSQLDTAALSAGWSIDTTGRGVPRVRVWPLPVGNPVAHFTDCADMPPEAVATTSQVYNADMAELVNVVPLTNTAGVTVTASDPTSGFRFGVRSDTLGLPAPVLSASTGPAMQTIADRIVARYKAGVDRLARVTVTADEWTDPADLVNLAALERGATVIVDRFEAAPVSTIAVVCGVGHRLERDAWSITVATTAATIRGIPLEGTAVWDELPGWDAATWWL